MLISHILILHVVPYMRQVHRIKIHKKHVYLFVLVAVRRHYTICYVMSAVLPFILL